MTPSVAAFPRGHTQPAGHLLEEDSGTRALLCAAASCPLCPSVPCVFCIELCPTVWVHTWPAECLAPQLHHLPSLPFVLRGHPLPLPTLTHLPAPPTPVYQYPLPAVNTLTSYRCGRHLIITGTKCQEEI